MTLQGFLGTAGSKQQNCAGDFIISANAPGS